MTRHLVDINNRSLCTEDLAVWLLYYLEQHGARIVMTPAGHVAVDLDAMVGLDADTVGRWAPTIVKVLPQFRAILLDRAAVIH